MGGLTNPAVAQIYDEGVLLAVSDFINFIGAGVTGSFNSPLNRLEISIAGAGAPGAHASTHVTGGSDVVSLGSLSGALVASQHPDTNHKAGGISVLNSARTPFWFIAGTLAIGSQSAGRVFVDRTWTIEDCRVHSRVAPSGGRIDIDIKYGDNTPTIAIFAAGSGPQILTGTIYGNTPVFGTTNVPSGMWLALGLINVGTNHAGEHLSVNLLIKQAVV